MSVQQSVRTIPALKYNYIPGPSPSLHPRASPCPVPLMGPGPFRVMTEEGNLWPHLRDTPKKPYQFSTHHQLLATLLVSLYEYKYLPVAIGHFLSLLETYQITSSKVYNKRLKHNPLVPKKPFYQLSIAI